MDEEVLHLHEGVRIKFSYWDLIRKLFIGWLVAGNILVVKVLNVLLFFR